LITGEQLLSFKYKVIINKLFLKICRLIQYSLICK
jgi:hypothetical protein